MKHVKNNLFLTFFLLAVIVFFFYPVFLKGNIPFPGDLLLAQYQPWRSVSYNGFAPGAVPNKAQYFDTLRQLYPWKTFVISAIKTKTVPLWNPYDFSGSPLLANFQSAVFFPLNILYFIFSQTTAWTILVLLQPFLCLLSVYFLARKFHLSKMASLFSCISYAFCLYMTSFLEYNIMGHYMYLVPFLMLCIEWVIEKKKWAYPVLSIFVAVSGFAGHAELFGGSIVYIILYAIMRILQQWSNFRHRITFFASILFFMLTGLGIAAIQLLPGLELIAHAARSAHNPEYFYTNLLIRPTQLILYFIPDLFGNPATKNYLVPFSYPSKALYVGLPALFFAALGFFSAKNNFWKVVVINTAIFASIIFLNPISFFIFKLNLPFLSSSSPSNFIFLISLGLCLLAGFGFDYFQGKKKIVIILLSCFWLVMLGIFLTTTFLHMAIVKNNLIYSTLVLFLLTIVVLFAVLNRNIKKIALISLILLACFDLFYFFHKFNPFVPSSYAYPKTQIGSWLKSHTGIDRVWGYSFASIEPNFPTQMNIYSPQGYDPLYPKEYGQLIQTTNNGKIPLTFTDETRSDALIAPGFGVTSIAQNPYRLKILSLLGVAYILDKTENGSTAQTFPPKLFDEIATINDFHVYKYKDATPRFFLTTSYEMYKNPNDFTNKFFDKKFDPSKTLLLQENPSIKAVRVSKMHANLLSYTPNSVVIKTTSNSQALLFLSDTYYPGWQAMVDNKKTKILRADYTFRAVVIPAGQHTITFDYTPASFIYGLYITVVSIIITGVSLIFI